MMGRDCHASGLEVHLSCCVVVGLDVKILFEVVSFTLGTTTNLRPGCVCVWEGGGDDAEPTSTRGEGCSRPPVGFL